MEGLHKVKGMNKLILSATGYRNSPIYLMRYKCSEPYEKDHWKEQVSKGSEHLHREAGGLHKMNNETETLIRQITLINTMLYVSYENF